MSTIDTWSAPDKGRESDLATDMQLCDMVRGSGYGASKAAGERFVLAAACRGVPACIVRPGFIGGHSSSGHSNPSDFIHRYLAACVWMECAIARGPQQGWSWEQTPVDFMARSCIVLADADAPGQGLDCPCFHVSNQRGTIGVAGIAAGIRELSGYEHVEDVDYATFRERLLTDCGEQFSKHGGSSDHGGTSGESRPGARRRANPLHTLLHMFRPESCGLFQGGHGRTEMGDEALSRAGLMPPQVTPGMIAAAVQSLARRGYIEQPLVAPRSPEPSTAGIMASGSFGSVQDPALAHAGSASAGTTS